VTHITLTNPAYIQMIKLGKSTRWTKPEVSIPVLTTRFLPAPNQTTIDLYPKQLEVFNEIKDYTTGLLEAMTGAGKTVIGIALHQAWGGRTLVICHSINMTNQTNKRFREFTDIEPTLFCNGKHDQSGEVVITTMTTFRQKYKEFVGFDNLIVDEADWGFSDKMLKAITEFECTRKHGFTGTIKTAYDDCNKQYESVLGEFWGAHVVYTSDKEIPLKAVFNFEYKKVYPDVFPHIKWQEFRGALDEDIERKKEQLRYILANTEKDGYSLCLWDRILDVEAFYTIMKKRGYTVYMSTGEMKKKDREEHLAGFEKTGGYLLGVSSTLNRGYDEVKLTKAFILHPIKGENPIRQSIGRVMRHLEGKESTLYLWSDSMLDFQLEQQKKIIKKFFNLDVCSKQPSEPSSKNGGT